jgi:hypothetical protein
MVSALDRAATVIVHRDFNSGEGVSGSNPSQETVLTMVLRGFSVESPNKCSSSTLIILRHAVGRMLGPHGVVVSATLSPSLTVSLSLSLSPSSQALPSSV